MNVFPLKQYQHDWRLAWLAAKRQPRSVGRSGRLLRCARHGAQCAYLFSGLPLIVLFVLDCPAFDG